MRVALIFACVIAHASADVSGYSTLGGGSRGRYSNQGSSNGGYNYNPAPASRPTSSGNVVDNDVPQVFKHVYVYTAPEPETQRENRVIRVGGGGNKHVNIIFAKVPSQSASSGTEIILPEADVHKNLVYLLLNKNNAEAPIKITRPQPQAQPKPEVHFIPYTDSESQSDASPVSPPADPVEIVPRPAQPSGLYGTPQAQPSGLYGIPQANPVEIAPPPPQADPVEIPPPPQRPSGLYGLPNL